jgi:hypothetical protein
MSAPVPSNGGGTQTHSEEWVFTLTNGVVTKIERVDATTKARSEISADEYTWVASGYYAAYCAGIRDYTEAMNSGNMDAVQAYYQGMAQYLGGLGYA